MLHLGPIGRAGAPRGESAPIDWPAHFQALAGRARDSRLKAYYAAGAVAGATPIAEVALAALDVETTGLDPAQDDIVSIGLVPMTVASIQASASRHWIVRPRAPLAADSVALHGITDSQIAHAPALADVLGEFLEAIAGRVLVVHCRAVERGFLDAALRRQIGEAIEFPVIDTMELEARVHRAPARGLLARWRPQPEPSIRLADSRARYQLPRYRAHHAPTDALASAELLQAQVAHRYSAQTPVAALWL